MHYRLYRSFFSLTKNYDKFINNSKQLISQVSNLFQFCEDGEIECDFVNLFYKCEKESVKYVNEITDDDIYFTLKWLQFVLLIFLQALFGFIGLINNILVLITICNKEKERLFREKIYKHLQINGYFLLYSNNFYLNKHMHQ
jgi:hypothetical protein